MNHTLIGLNLRMNAVNWRWKQVEPAVLPAEEHGQEDEAEAAGHPVKRPDRGMLGEYGRDKGSAVPGSRTAGKERRHVR